jgi:hypothetical protein
LPVDEHETSGLNHVGNKLPTPERKTGETTYKEKDVVCTNAHGMDLQQSASEKMYDTKAEYNEENDNNNKGYFHPQFPPSLVKEAETMMAVRRLPFRIGIRWKMQSRLKQRQQATGKVSKEGSYDHKSIEYNAVETNPHSSDPPFGVLRILTAG